MACTSSSIPWVLLDRAPRLTDLHGEIASEADLLLKLLRPPAVSMAFIDSSLLPDAAAWDTEAPCRVEGTDASGRVLVSLPSPRAPGECSLLVCRPIPKSSGGAAEAKGAAYFLPAFPEEEHGLAISPAAPTGIIATSGGTYFVAQLQRPPSSSRPVIALALSFSSDNGGWTMVEVTGDDCWSGFRATSVVSHDRGVHGHGTLVFVDAGRGLLLFDPRFPAWRFVEFPDCGGGAGGAMDGIVHASEGSLVYLNSSNHGTSLSLWCLIEAEELHWEQRFDLPCDEIFACDDRLLPLQGGGWCFRALDPDKMTRIIFAVRPAATDHAAETSLCVEVFPNGTVLRRVKLLGEVQRCASSSDAMICHVQYYAAAKRSWVMNSVECGRIRALSLFQKARQYADKLPGVVELVGGILGFPAPITTALLGTANALRKANDSLLIAENLSTWFQQLRLGASDVNYKVVGSMKEAKDALDEWVDLNKPKNMMVDPCGGLPGQEWQAICRFFEENGGQTLIQHHEYEMVERAPY